MKQKPNKILWDKHKTSKNTEFHFEAIPFAVKIIWNITDKGGTCLTFKVRKNLDNRHFPLSIQNGISKEKYAQTSIWTLYEKKTKKKLRKRMESSMGYWLCNFKKLKNHIFISSKCTQKPFDRQKTFCLPKSFFQTNFKITKMNIKVLHTFETTVL